MFTHADGRPIRPEYLTHRFRQLCKELGLPPIRLNNLRHGAATLPEMSGVASDASLPGKRDHGAVGDAEEARQGPELGLSAKAQVRMPVRLRVASDNTVWHQILL